MKERMLYIGDGIRAPETNELVGTPVNVKGNRGKVVENDAFTITVEWDKKTISFSQLLRYLCGKPMHG